MNGRQFDARRRPNATSLDVHVFAEEAPNRCTPVQVADLAGETPANDKRHQRALHELDPFTRCYRRLSRKLRAAVSQYVEREDVEDLMQDVWTIAAQRPAKLVESDARTLSWLIGIAKRCASSYRSADMRLVPVDEMLAREAGDDLEGRAFNEDVTELAVELWGSND